METKEPKPNWAQVVKCVLNETRARALEDWRRFDRFPSSSSRARG